MELMKFSFRVKGTGNLEIIEAKNADIAFKKACEQYGITGFSDFNRYYDNANWVSHTMDFLKRGISNTTKHIHKQNRRGFKNKTN